MQRTERFLPHSNQLFEKAEECNVNKKVMKYFLFAMVFLLTAGSACNSRYAQSGKADASADGDPLTATDTLLTTRQDSPLVSQSDPVENKAFTGLIRTGKAEIAGVWTLLCFTDLSTRKSEYQTDRVFEYEAHNRPVVLELSKSGKISGHSVTNSMDGAWEVRSGNSFYLTDFSITEMMEPAWGSRFSKAFMSCNPCGVRSHLDSLQLVLPAGDVVMTFLREGSGGGR
jgi:hypothetical protein